MAAVGVAVAAVVVACLVGHHCVSLPMGGPHPLLVVAVILACRAPPLYLRTSLLALPRHLLLPHRHHHINRQPLQQRISQRPHVRS